MYKLSTRLAIVILTFVIGTFAVTGYFFYQDSQKIQLILPNALLESSGFNGIEDKGGINQATELAGLTELRKSHLKEGDVEIRVWRGFGLSPLEGVILRRTAGQWSALYVKTDNYYDFEKVEVQQLNSPKSGWESFWKQIVNKEILTLQQSTEDDCNNIIGDAISYVVEINQDKVYRNYAYQEGNKRRCHEAKQMADIGEFIGLEFDSGQEQCKTTEWFACMTFLKTRNQTNQ